jgi:hypothetical protein
VGSGSGVGPLEEPELWEDVGGDCCVGMEVGLVTLGFWTE